jgi:hypothetical protein
MIPNREYEFESRYWNHEKLYRARDASHGTDK